MDLPRTKTRSLKTTSSELPLPPGGEEHPLLNPGQGQPQPRNDGAHVGPGTTTPQDPRRPKLRSLHRSEPAPEVTGLPAPLFLHTLPPSSPPPGAPRKNEAFAREERA